MKPMLAARPKSINDLIFPLYGSFKFDGIRALVTDVLSSRRLTPIKNRGLREQFTVERGFGFMDGELYLPPHIGDFHMGSGIVRSADDTMSVKIDFQVFDHFEKPKLPFYRRYELLKKRLDAANPFCNAYLVEQHLIEDLDDLLSFEEEALKQKFEGVMLRHPEGPYKFGRSTMKEHWLIKLKRFSDAEAKIIGFKEQMRNENEATRDALGKMKRSKHLAHMRGKDTLGAIECVGLNGRFKGVEFDISGGSKQEGAMPFDDAVRKKIWTNPKAYLGRTITYTYFEPGSKDAPRHAGLLRFRDGGL